MATILHDSIGIAVAVVVVTQVYAPMSITASHYNHEKMNSWDSIAFLHI